MPGGYELRRSPHSDAEQHLEFVAVSGETLEPLERTLDQPLVVGGGTHVAVELEQRVERLDEIGPDGVAPLVGNRGRLDVDPLAEPDGRAEISEVADVRERPPQA